jgi:anti-anti-sigma factor
MSITKTVRVLQPSGVLTGATSDALLQDFQKCLDEKIQTLLIDLQDIQFIDSAGLGALVSIMTRLRLAGGKLYLCSLNEQAQGIFDISDLDQIFNIYSNRQRAVEAMRGT